MFWKLCWKPAGIAVLLMAMGLSACSPKQDEADSSTPTQKNLPKVGLVMKSLANEFFLSMEIEAKRHQAEHSDQYQLIANGIKDEQDVAGQIRIVEQMIALEVDVIVIAPADSSALLAVIKRATDAGITVVNIDNRFDPTAMAQKGLRLPFVGPDNHKGARMVGDYLAQSLQAGDEVAILAGHPASDNSKQRVAGFQAAMQAIAANIVSEQAAMWEMDKANNIASVLLNEKPALKAILCANDSMALGAVAAIKAAGKTGQVLVVGYDNITAIKTMVTEGRVLATLDQFADQQAVSGILLGLEMASKQQVQAAPEQLVTQTPIKLITAADIP